MKCRVAVFLIIGWGVLSLIGYLKKDGIYKNYSIDVKKTPYFGCAWYTILYNFIGRYFSMPENYITCQDEKGSINISEDVVAAMVRAAITEVDGVAGVATSTGTELAELLGIKSAAKGIKVQIVDGTMTVDTIITVRYGCSVVAVAKAVQESVTSAVESMTGMGKPIVNVHVSGVAFDK